MAEDKERINKLKLALLAYLGTNGRHYGDMSRLEQSVEDLVQALNTRLDQLLYKADGRQAAMPEETPGVRLANRFLEYANKLNQGGRVDTDIVDEFEKTLEMLDLASDLKRQSETVKDAADTTAIKYKRGKV